MHRSSEQLDVRRAEQLIVQRQCMRYSTRTNAVRLRRRLGLIGFAYTKVYVGRHC